MRSLAGAATVLICAAAGAAGAQTYSSQDFNGPKADFAAAPSALALLNEAAFAPRTASDRVDPISSLIARETYEPGQGPVRWQTGETRLSASAGGPIDSLRVSVGGVLRAVGGAPVNLANAQYEARAYEVALTRDWPAAISFEGKAFGVDVTPHAGVGVTNIGGSAEAGATLQLSQRQSLREQTSERLKALGLRDGAHFGDRGRWYLFAAASGRAVGLNMLHNQDGWDRAGWTQDAASTLVGDAQVGVGFRKGPMQTSLGYIHREVKGQHMIWGQDTRGDSMVAFSLSIKPKF
ncbi:MAG TPA: lipid A-modifier LpxR family protein [Phenylobacterium sp.]|jgi:hypothetical protein